MTSRARSPIAPSRRPRPVVADAVTTTTSTSAGICRAGSEKSSSRRPAMKTTADANSALSTTGSERPRNNAARFAGDASSGPSVPELPLVSDRHRHREDAPHRRRLHGVADDVELVVAEAREAPEVREEEELRDRDAEHRRRVRERPHPVEERAIADDAAHDEDAGHVGAHELWPPAFTSMTASRASARGARSSPRRPRPARSRRA